MILVLGAGGLLGSTVCRLFPKDTIGATRRECDVSQSFEIRKFVEKLHPDILLNCTGIVRNRSVPVQYRYKINTAAPILMADICDDLNIRFIQMSTDCVFDGALGNYVETDTPTPEDSYGITKLGGEIIREPHLTVRASFIGWPDPNGRGLIAWLMSKAGRSVPGYTEVMWNGLTVTSLASYLVELAYVYKISGLRHIFGETVSKFDVLTAVNAVYGLGCKIVPTDLPVKNMTLRTVYNDLPYIPDTFNLYDQVRLMKELNNGLTD